MRIGILAFFIGVLLFHQLADLPPGDGRVTLACGLLLLVFQRSRPWGALLCGFSWAWFTAAAILSDPLPLEWQGRDLFAQGVVADFAQRRHRSIRFVLVAERLYPVSLTEGSPGSIGRPMRLRLSWFDADRIPRPGERWRLRVRLKRPHGFMNPGTFDYERWSFSQRVRAVGYVRGQRDNALLSAEPGGLDLQRLRRVTADRLEPHLASLPNGAVLRALAIGERSRIDERQWKVLRTTGTSHLVAISGLHVGLVAAFSFFAVRKIWSNLAAAPRYLAAPQAAAIAAIAVALFYALLAGLSLPTQRALVMTGVVFVGVLRKREVMPTRSLAIALAVVLIWDPLATLSAGFWLSFGAVAIILVVVTGRLGQPIMWHRAVQLQGVLLIGLAPLLWLFFGQLSWLAPLANLVAVPAVGLVVVPAVLLATTLSAVSATAASFLFHAADRVLQAVWWFLETLTWIPSAQWSPPAAGIIPLVMLGCAATLVALPRGTPARWLAGVLCLPFVLHRAPAPQMGDVWLSVLDVGQGLSAIVRTAQHTLVYDTGPRFSEDFNAGQAVLVPFLRHVGRGLVDTLVLSHGDLDHVGGANSLRESLPVLRVLRGDSAAALAGPSALPCRAGEGWTWDGVHFEFVHPNHGEVHGDNDGSCVLYVRSAGGTILLPGDIGGDIEQHLVERFGSGLRADVLVVPHHGSASSSTLAFVAQVRPRLALVAAGYRNRFGFPRPAVTARYRASGARVLSTATHGAIETRISADHGPGRPLSQRERARRYWHHVPAGQSGAVVGGPQG